MAIRRVIFVLLVLSNLRITSTGKPFEFNSKTLSYVKPIALYSFGSTTDYLPAYTPYIELTTLQIWIRHLGSPTHRLVSGLYLNFASSNRALCCSLGTLYHTRYLSRRLSYYHNGTESFNPTILTIVRSGDVHPQPGPTRAPKCPNCTKPVQQNHRRFICETCKDLYHALCTDLSLKQLKNVRSDKIHLWTCGNCILSLLPFHKVRDFNDSFNEQDSISQDEEKLDQHMEALLTRKEQLRVLHLNTQSMVSSFDEFLMTIRDYPFDIISMSETWLKENEYLLRYVTINGYSHIFRHRDNIKGGGVGLYIKDSLKYKRRKDIENICPEFEHLWIEIEGRNRNSKLLLGTIYRSKRMLPTHVWMDKFESLLGYLTVYWDGLLLITGDMNIDVSQPLKPLAIQYTNILHSMGLIQHISTPTRSTSSTSTIIDHIISNLANRVTHTDVIPCPLVSDHDGPYACVNIRVTRYEPRYKWIRWERDLNEEALIKDLSNLNFESIYMTDDLDTQVNLLNTLICGCLEKHIPLRRIKFTRPPAPWMNTENMRVLKDKRNNLRFLAHKLKSPLDWDKYRAARNEIKKEIKKAKREFYKKALSSKKPKEVWRVINQIIHPCPKKLNMDPNKLNEHFCTTAQRTLNITPDHTTDIESLISSLDNLPIRESEFTLRPVTPGDISQEIRSLKSDCSTGCDNIPAKYIKLVPDILDKPLAHIINSSFNKGIFPSPWKIGRVTPIPKVELPLVFNDVRPITILPVFSKIMERVVLHQLLDYINCTNILGECMSGFRKGHSTATLLMKIRDDIISAMKRSEVTLMVMADFSKAFDTLDFKTAINKFYAYGFSSDVLRWISSYLFNRKQYVLINDLQSDVTSLSFGVPQGSILGPILFNLYVSDLNSSCPMAANTAQYADDTTLYLHSPLIKLDGCTKSFNNDLDNFADWAKSSNLALNLKKTKCMLFSTHQLACLHNLKGIDLPLKINDTSLERKSSYKLLGTYFQDNLKWDEAVTHITSSCYAALSLLRKIKHFTPYKVKKQLIQSLVLSKLDYNSTVLFPLTSQLESKLQKVQNVAASFITNKFVREPDILKLNWLPIHEQFKYNILKFAHKAMYLPNWPSYLKLQKTTITRTLRSNTAPRLIIPLENGTFQDSAACIFNKLSPETRSIRPYRSFINVVKSYLHKEAITRLS